MTAQPFHPPAFPPAAFAARTLSLADASILRPAPFHAIGFIGNSMPRRCGIATFTTHLQQAIAGAAPSAATAIVAMNDPGSAHCYPPTVGAQVAQDNIDDYVRAADFLNGEGFDVVSLQHEFGIFGGPAGEHVNTLLARLGMPVVTTLHTVLARPSQQQRAALDRVVNASARVIVMAEKAKALLCCVHGVPASKIDVVPHGIPDVAFAEPDAAKARLGLAGRKVILTFGLLSPNKGIEVMIDAMPAILRAAPDAVYVVLGATHPHLVRDQGEAYRESLLARARALGVAEHVIFLDRFVDEATLLGFIGMCDVYVTPYLEEAQITSGTLSYSFGLGKAVVSTPYWHARELLAGGRGVLVPFADAGATGSAVAGLLADDAGRDALRRRAYAASRPMTWGRTADRYLDVFEAARKWHRAFVARLPRRPAPQPAPSRRLPAIATDHLVALSDDTGLLQHARHKVADRAHGYCVDDNARALLLSTLLAQEGSRKLPDALTDRFAAFVQHAWNADARRFRNFMSFDRSWLEEAGSEDSHARCLWALGVVAGRDPDGARAAWAAGLFAESLAPALAFGSPRAWAFTLLGLDAWCGAKPDDAAAADARRHLAERLLGRLADAEAPGWLWFEDVLGYDNARLPQALIATGTALSSAPMIERGLAALRWLMAAQTAAAGHFRPVGSESFGALRTPPRHFDQQPLEAAASISACLAAFAAGQDAAWPRAARRCLAWFQGANDLGIALVDEDGSCRDGLHPDRANGNRGAESVLSWLLGLVELRRFAALEQTQRPVRSTRREKSFKQARQSSGLSVARHAGASAGPGPSPRSFPGDPAVVQAGD